MWRAAASTCAGSRTRSASPKRPWHGAGLEAYDELCRLAAATPPGADKLVFLPHLGGRNTPNNTDMRGLFIGLNCKHGKGHMFRAMMESIGYEYALYLRSVRTIAPDIRPTRALSIGGGAKSRVFRQIKADILGPSYQGLDRAEIGTLGAAIVTGKAVGLFDDVGETAQRLSRPTGEPVLPAGTIARVTTAMRCSTRISSTTRRALFHRLANVEG